MSDSDEADVVEVKAANALLPNLTISVEKDEDETGPTVEFEDEDNTNQQKLPENEEMEIKLELKSFPHTKIYENKALKDLGLTPEEAKLRRENRAKRFRSPLVREAVEVEDEINETEVEEFIKAAEEYSKIADENDVIRLDAVHLRGLDDMTTDDIFSFFSDFLPSHIEWINDTSCNVVWKDDDSAAKAILGMTRKISEPRQEVEGQENPVKHDEGDDLELDLMESDEEMEVEGANTPKKEKPSVESKNGNKMEESEENKEEKKTFTNELKRCHKPFSKKERKVLLKLRFATKGDKKILGGAKKSKFYQKYGNPNYGNVRGILSRSYMKRYHGRVAKREFENYKPVGKNEEEEREIPNEDEKKTVKKRMYSDLEGVRSKKQKLNEGSESGGSSEDSGDSADEQEREDMDLIHSSAKDLSDAIPTDLIPSEEEEPDTMMADRISKKIESARRSLEVAQQSGNLNVNIKSGNVWARLGKKHDPEMVVTVKNERPEERRRHRQEEQTMRDRLPESLKSRLGSKRH